MLPFGPKWLFMKRLTPALFASIICTQAIWAQAPTGLTVQSATSSQVQLTWSGTSGNFTVQRAPVGAAFVNIATVQTTSYTDTTIDPYLQFTYQIINAGTTGQVSNQVTVGPPPAGLSLVAASPLNGDQVNLTYGDNVSVAYDSNGDPAFAFLFGDPNADGVASEGQLFFRSWNRAQAQWNSLVRVATPGNVSNGDRSSIALAYDTSTKTFALATEDLATNIDLYTSPTGAAWTLSTSFTGPAGMGGLAGPALALAAGNIYFAYQAGGTTGLQYVTGKLSAGAATWTTSAPPAINNVGPANGGAAPAVAIDSSGNPAVAFFAPDVTTDGGEILFFWRPGLTGNSTAPPVEAANTGGIQPQELGLRMVFYRENPRIGFAGATSATTSANDQNINFVRSDDGGNTWQPAVAIPTDGSSTDDYPVDVAVDATDNAALAFESNVGTGDGKCGEPKLALSSDLVNFTVCQVAPDLGNFTGNPGAIQIAFAGNSKRYVFWQSNGDGTTNSGVVMYREPPDNQPTGPVLSNVLDAESSRATIVPGEWVAIYGANLAGTTRTWSQPDFDAAGPGNLPSSLSGVSVQFGSLPASVYYISPTQLDVLAPGTVSGTVPVTVTNNGAISGSFNVTIVQNAPSLYYYAGGSNLYAAALHADYSLIGDPAVTSTATKAAAGETILLFVNGVAPAPGGIMIPADIQFSGAVTVTFGSGATAATATPGFTALIEAGVYQMNVVVPSTLTTGNYPLTVTVQGQSSPAMTVLLPVQ
jgi:uncharacterized protein (TIGR03437 family)